MATVRELVTKLGFQADERQADRYDRSLHNIRRTALRVTTAVAGISAAVFGLSSRLAKSGEALSNNATEVGLTTEAYQRLSFALQQVGSVTEEDVTRALGRLNQRIGRARREGGQYADALQDMGFSTEQINDGTISASQAMDHLVDRLENAKSASEAAAVAGDLLGTRLGRRIGPAIFQNAGAMAEASEQAEKLGLGFSDAAVAASNEFTGGMDQVRMIMRTISSDIAERLLPAMNNLIQRFVSWFEANRDLIDQGLGMFLDGLGTSLRLVFGSIRLVMGAVNHVIQLFGGWLGVLRPLKDLFVGFVAMRLGKVFLSIAAGILRAKTVTQVLRIAMLALSRVPLVAMLTAVGAVIQDVIGYFRGQDSVTGALVEKFKSLVGWLKSSWQWLAKVGHRISKVFGSGNRVAPATEGDDSGGDSSGRNVARQIASVAGVQSGGTRNVNVNARTEATLQVPQGTPDEQRESISRQAESIFRDHWDRQLNNALWNFQPVE